MVENRVGRILLDVKLSRVRALLEKSGAIEYIFLLYMKKGGWKEAKEFMESMNQPLTDGAFRARMTEMAALGLVDIEAIDPLKRQYKLTDYGRIVANLLLEFFEELQAWSPK